MSNLGCIFLYFNQNENNWIVVYYVLDFFMTYPKQELPIRHQFSELNSTLKWEKKRLKMSNVNKNKKPRRK